MDTTTPDSSIQRTNASDDPKGADVAGRKRRPKPLVVISHRQADMEIATRIANWLEGATGTRVEVFQSSSGFKGGDAARSITDTIRENVADAAMMLVLYTDDDADWAWVMFEMGIAMDPTTPSTELIILQCGDDSPKILSDFTRVRVAQEQPRIGLVRKLLTTRAYPTHPDFFIADDKEGYVKGQANGLWEQLKDLIPDAPMKRETTPYPSLRIDVPLESLGSLTPGGADRREGLRQPIRENGRVTAESEIQRVFELATTLNLTLDQLRGSLSQFDQAQWIDSCVDTLAGSALNNLPQKPIASVNSVSGGTPFRPLLMRTQYKWFDRVIRFDLTFVPARLLLDVETPAEATAEA